jgi:hypothetical protein
MSERQERTIERLTESRDDWREASFRWCQASVQLWETRRWLAGQIEGTKADCRHAESKEHRARLLGEENAYRATLNRILGDTPDE